MYNEHYEGDGVLAHQGSTLCVWPRAAVCEPLIQSALQRYMGQEYAKVSHVKT